jgi:hypothetical protein
VVSPREILYGDAADVGGMNQVLLSKAWRSVRVVRDKRQPLHRFGISRARNTWNIRGLESVEVGGHCAQMISIDR